MIQQCVADKRLILCKEKGEYNIADLPTKHLYKATMLKHLNAMNIHVVSGSSKLAIGVARHAMSH